MSGLTSRAKIDSIEVYSTFRTLCQDSCNATVIVEVFAGTSPGAFQVIWKGNNLPGGVHIDTTLTTDTLFNLCPGEYSVEVVDTTDNDKVAPFYFTIQNGNKIDPEIVFTEPTCHDSLNGSLDIIAVNHAGTPYNILWSTGETLPTLDSIGKGMYGLTITDAYGCVYQDSFKLTGPDSLQVNIGGTDVTCKNLCDATAFTNPTGGTPTYSYLWTNGDTNNLLTNLCPGKFIVTVTDMNGCTATDSIELTEPDSLLSTFNITDPNCNGSCDGQIVASTSGGVRPLTYHWSGYNDNDSTLDNACAGNVAATITDANGCYYTEILTVNEPDPLTLQSTVNASTCGVCDGDISVSISGGSSPYHYLWVGQKAEDTIPSIDSLCPGIYRLAIKDNSGCTDTFDIALSDDTSGIKDLNFNVVQATCEDVCDGAISATVLGGTSPFSYSWSPGGQSDSVITGLCAGTHTLEVTDGTGCIRIEQVTLYSESNLSASYATEFNGCAGDCGGRVSLNANDGVGPYSFSWIGSSSSASIAENLCVGTYPFKVTDGNGCVFRDTAEIIDPDTIGLSVSVTDASCYGECDGSASLMVTSGVAPFSYNWSNGSTASSISKLCAGSHWVEVIDANSCIKRVEFNVSEPVEINANITLFDAECGINNGGAIVAPTGGTGPYTYCWFNNTYSDSVSGLFSSLGAQYWVKIKDSVGCEIQENFAISDSDAPDYDVIVTDETCYGGCDGTVEIVTNGPVSSYFLKPLTNPPLHIYNKFAGLCAGDYVATIEFDGICYSSRNVEIEPAQRIEVDFDITYASCHDVCDASIIASVKGGLPPYTVSWSNGSNLNAISGLCSGSYTINVTDANGCAISQDVEIENPSEISVSLSTSNLTCYDVCDGRITSVVNGGKGPYTYLWSNGGNGAIAENLCEGIYWVQVTDVNGCTDYDTIAIGNGVPISASFFAVDADCGQCNGSLTVTASAGNGPPHSYLWSNGDTNSTISDLAAGIYHVTIIDNSGCSEQFTTTLNNVGGPSLSDTSYNVSCFGLCDGSAKAMASGATAPYVYQWYDPMMQTGDSASALCEGHYFYSATDSNGCVSYDSVTVYEPTEIMITSSITGITCPGDSTGSIEVMVNGGATPYTYSWSNGDTTALTDSLAQGTYTLVVMDSSGCSAEDTFDLMDPVSLSVNFTADNTNCFGSCDGLVIANVSGGSSPYTYQWNDPSSQNTQIAAGLCAGYVSVTVTDANGCQTTDSALISSPPAIVLSPSLNNPSCENGDNGSIDLVIAGGSPPFWVTWDNGMSGANISGLTAGTYAVTIIDSNNCVMTDSYTLNDPSNPLSLTVNISNASCGMGDGSASAIASNGSGSYTFVWNTIPTQTGSSAIDLWPGIYEVTVTDGVTGCIKTETFYLGNTGGPTITFTKSDVKCDSSGSAKASPGSGKFTFLWSDGQTDSVAIGLGVGLYWVRVEDTVSGCVTIDTVSILDSTDFSAAIQNVNALDCYGDCDGEATVAVIRGTPPFTYTWNTSPAQTTPTATNLCSGTYVVEASDTLGCSESIVVDLPDPDSISLDLSIISNAICAGSCDGRAGIGISGGTGPFTILWDGMAGGDVITGLCPGSHTVEVVDFNGCSKTLSFTINDAVPILANAFITQPNCGLYDGSIILNPSGGTGPYFYSWSNGESTSETTNLFAGVYWVDITDARGCTERFNFFLNNQNAPALTFDKNTVECNGDCNGVARVSPSGGISPYSYIWDHVPVSTVDSLTDLCSGVYFVKVTDATGCIAYGADTITEPPVLDGTLTKITDGCGGNCGGEAMLIAQGGTAPYNYVWNSTPPQNTATATGLCAGTATVLLTDDNGCEFIDSVDIIPPPELVIDSLITTNASCFTNADGEAAIYHSGGTAPVRYFWSDGQTTQTAGTLNNGTYAITLTDTNGCTAMDSAIIGVVDTVLVSAFVDSFVCIGNQALLLAKGQGATTFNWFEDSSGTLKPIAAGDSIFYTVHDSVTIYLRGQNDASPPCFDLDTGYIVGIAPPQITASAASNVIDEGSTTELLASPFLFNGSYAWTPSNSLNDSASIAPLAFPQETTTYTVIGIDEFGCSGSDTVTVTVVEDNSIINGFTPNGDGVNDKWIIPSLEDYPKVIVEVYNRWGTQVFRSEGYKEPWDGTYEGKLLPSASYYYVIDYHGNGETVATGAVTIMY